MERRLSRSTRRRQAKTNMTLRDVQNVIQGFFQPYRQQRVQDVDRNSSIEEEGEDDQGDEESNEAYLKGVKSAIRVEVKS